MTDKPGSCAMYRREKKLVGVQWCRADVLKIASKYLLSNAYFAGKAYTRCLTYSLNFGGCQTS